MQKMADGEVGGQQFPVKSRIAAFCGRQFFREKTEGLPQIINFLMEHPPNMGVRCVRGER
ncbi:MAG: hypothetical protein AN484_25325 [Aphanizomenon flos-aquae WA102]|uniref:Uncharacterized protein n=1 Tax=Aphanizomenon flos-aquae WA102 TaxID=1710896 RepID=A0A1B7WII2_APHFL|nr:MAG: hypothetical protein AN484_25325 [Aphanizomenon flos-aquae WA102]